MITSIIILDHFEVVPKVNLGERRARLQQNIVQVTTVNDGIGLPKARDHGFRHRKPNQQIIAYCIRQ